MAAASSRIRSTCSNWASLPADLLAPILDRIIIDYPSVVRFCSVCKSWRSVALVDYDMNNKNQLLPMLMIPVQDKNKEKKKSLYSITDGVGYDMQLSVLPYKRCIFGSSHGWLFTIDNYISDVITLVHPLSNRTIRLPELKDPENNYNYWAFKGILSSDPCLNPNDYLVLVIYKDMKKLASLRPGLDKSWKFINILPKQVGFSFSDALFYKGHIYAVNLWSALVEVDISSSSTTSSTNINRRVVTEPLPTTGGLPNQVYIVQSSQEGGRLLLVQRIQHIGIDPLKADFHVYKLVKNRGSKCAWDKVESLPGEALFLGENYSHSIVVSSQSTCSWFTQNCIYYANHRFKSKDDTGVFRLEDRSFGKHFVPDPTRHNHLSSFPPIWI